MSEIQADYAIPASPSPSRKGYRYKEAKQKMNEAALAVETESIVTEKKTNEAARAVETESVVTEPLPGKNRIERNALRLASEWKKEQVALAATTKKSNGGDQMTTTNSTVASTPTTNEMNGSNEMTPISPVRNELPAILEADGVLATSIKRASYDMPLDSMSREVHQKVASDFNQICQHEQSSFRRSYWRWEDGSVNPLMPHMEYNGCANSVLRFCIARRMRFMQVTQKWRAAAWRAYVDHKAAYDSILGGFIPRFFKRRAEDHLREQAYLHGSNATAAGDWDIFRQHLETRRQNPLSAIKTGLPELNELLGGGLQGLTFLGGTPAISTAFFRQSCVSWPERPKSTAVKQRSQRPSATGESVASMEKNGRPLPTCCQPRPT